VHLQDPKYGIDGYYLSDPTWDNEMNKDAYNHALMTQDEYDVMDRPNYQSNYTLDDMFFVHSPEEFFYIVNYYLDKKDYDRRKGFNEAIKNKVTKYKMAFVRFMQELQRVDPKTYDYYNYVYKNIYNATNFASNIIEFHKRIAPVVKNINNSSLSNCFSELDRKLYSIKSEIKESKENVNKDKKMLMNNLIKSFKMKDINMYNYLMIKYAPFVDDNALVLPEEKFQEFITEVGTYITNKVNKPISGETLVSAIREVYLKAYNTPEEEIDNVMNEIIEYNKKRQTHEFPTRYMINKDGNKVPIANETNKFDIVTNTYTK
jgi:hypothetical protein